MDIRQAIKEKIQVLEPNAEVILFGSRARGDAKIDSDWDILILVSGEVNLKREQLFRHQLFELELIFGQAISTFVYSKDNWNKQHFITPLYQNIKKEGIVI
jgi:predicted nucleotidyltransferase